MPPFDSELEQWRAHRDALIAKLQERRSELIAQVRVIEAQIRTVDAQLAELGASGSVDVPDPERDTYVAVDARGNRRIFSAHPHTITAKLLRAMRANPDHSVESWAVRAYGPHVPPKTATAYARSLLSGLTGRGVVQPTEDQRYALIENLPTSQTPENVQNREQSALDHFVPQALPLSSDPDDSQAPKDVQNREQSALDHFVPQALPLSSVLSSDPTDSHTIPDSVQTTLDDEPFAQEEMQLPFAPTREGPRMP
jgi:hypothetical protein